MSTSAKDASPEATANGKGSTEDSRAALRGTFFTFGLRLISFACTQVTLRYLDPTALGRASIQLELLLTTVLFFSREGFRLALTRNLTAESWNVAWLTIPLVSLVAGLALVWHLSRTLYSGSAGEVDSDYVMAGALYCLASWIEGCAEPAVLHFLRRMDTPKRSSAEALGTMAKAFATVVGLQYLGPTSVTAFGLSQLLYSLTYAIYLYWNAWNTLPMPNRTFDGATCSRAFQFTLQGVFKHLLTEADKIVLTTLSDSYNQGVYAMGSSYGGLAARILLQPLEENARLLLSRLAMRHAFAELEQSFLIFVKLVLYIGLLFSFVAVNYTNLLLCLLAGREWGSNEEAANVLSAFCVYTAFLAANGMTEAFVYGVTRAGMMEVGISHAVTGITLVVLAPWATAKGAAAGLVAVNCLAMLMRSCFSLHLASKYFGEKESKPPRMVLLRLLRNMSPHPMVIASYGLSWAVTRHTLGKIKERGFHTALQIRNKEWLWLTGHHLVAGVFCVVVTLSLAITMDRQFIRSFRLMIRQKND
ncbi:unnamed protein product [Cylindrotheca closterium]|uniref:Protein RFT1 homolog n=1 Tax=Cylindrotheca closterium TaxID=2856 RepID=A0AAD2CRA9_9STRA|nr:unnamed protein product [Cylindrotheca closterium]